MNTEQQNKLDALMDQVPQNVPSERDLWPGIEARLSRDSRDHPVQWSGWLWRAAAAALLIAGSSFTTAVMMQRNIPETAARGPEETRIVPAGLAGEFVPGQKYRLARESLVADFNVQVAQLPKDTQRKVQNNLAQIERALEEIGAALETNPNSTLLQQLLVTTYQEELDVLAGVNRMTLTRIDT